MSLRSKAMHHPSSRRAMLIPPQLSISIYFSGTPVSVISNTSRRQQFALQVAHVTIDSGMFINSIVIYYDAPAQWILICSRVFWHYAFMGYPFYIRIKKGKSLRNCPFLKPRRSLNSYYVLSLRTFLALSYGELNFLAFR